MTRVAVVGSGVVGAAAARALARRGAEVTLHEQFELEHTRGSSHGRSRIVRRSYPDPGWVRLADEARAGWVELEEEQGVTLLEPVPFVEVTPPGGTDSAAALAELGIEHRLLDPEAARALGIVLPDSWTATLEPGAAVVRADLARRALLDSAATHGTRVVERSRVDSPDEHDADVVVVAAGAWVRDLVPDVPVRVTRETVVYFGHDGPPLPSVVDLDPRAGGHAMYALHDPLHGLKAGAHHAGPEVDPHVEGLPDEHLVARVVEWLRERLPDVDPEPLGAETCLYTTTADEGFVLERRGRVVVASACSGHGFKFAPAVGEIVAELALA